jgi:hypothetical protein
VGSIPASRTISFKKWLRSDSGPFFFGAALSRRGVMLTKWN